MLDEDYVCLQRVYDEHDSKLEDECGCHVSCDERTYEVTASVSQWPSENFWVDVAIDLGYDDPVQNGGDELQEMIQINYHKAEIFFKTLNIQTIVQTAKYNDEGYFAALGGALSFYIGFALIMVFEIVEFFYDLFIACWLAMNGPK